MACFLRSSAGLLGRWGLDENAGNFASNSVPGQPDGLLANAPAWVPGYPLLAPPSTPPEISLTSPTNASVVLAGTNLTLSASAFDADGVVQRVDFFTNNVLLASVTNYPYACAWNNLPWGTFAITARAVDDAGLTATSAAVRVTALTWNLSLTNNPVPGAPPTLAFSLADPRSLPWTVSFYGRSDKRSNGEDFTIVALPDTQYYSQLYPQIFQAQTDWIISNRTALNIVYVAHLGDISNNGDNPTNYYQWLNATNALYRLESPELTGLPDGIPLGVIPGNHDHLNNTMSNFNTFFSLARFQKHAYYGGNYGTNNQSHYDLFTAGGQDFIALGLDFYYAYLDYTGLDAWANALLRSNASRRAILFTHDLLKVTGDFDPRGLDIFNNVKNNPNLILMFCGHNHGEFQRIESWQGRRIDICLSDFQSDTNGGNGYLRLYQFSPSNDVIHVKTYSPYVGQYYTDANSQFDIPLTPLTTLLLSTNLASGNSVSLAWTNLALGTPYSWYISATDGTNVLTSAISQFNTYHPPARLTIAPGGPTLQLQGLPAHSYEILTSTHLTNWTLLATLPSDTNGCSRFTDTNPPPTRRFYRARATSQ